jgi:ABC-type antimicrobial peptide transport system permease subunit
VRVHERPTPVVYVPMTSVERVQLVVRAAAPAAVLNAVQAAVGAIRPEIRARVWLPADQLARRLEPPRRYATLGAGLALFALTLAIGGLVGVTVFHVRARRREMAIRVAVGATDRDVARQLLRLGLRPVAVGLGVGAGVILAGGPLIAGLLHGLSPRDPVALGVAALILAASAVGSVALVIRASRRVELAAVLRE